MMAIMLASRSIEYLASAAIPVEDVARSALQASKAWVEANIHVDEHLARQSLRAARQLEEPTNVLRLTLPCRSEALPR